MTKKPSPIKTIRHALDRLEREGYEGYEVANADARAALADVEAVVASAQRLPDIIEHERHYHRASPDMNEPNRGACKLCREVVRLQAVLAPFRVEDVVGG